MATISNIFIDQYTDFSTSVTVNAGTATTVLNGALTDSATTITVNSTTPFPNNGTLTYLREMIEQKSYIMANAPSIFGNSGGGLFHGESGHLLGLTSRVTVTQMGFGLDVQTWMNFSTHPERLYEFFEHQELQFLYNDQDNYYDAIKRRESKRKEALRSIIFQEHGVDDSPASPASPDG